MYQCIKFILFWIDTLHVSDGLSVHHQEFKTVHTVSVWFYYRNNITMHDPMDKKKIVFKQRKR